MTKTDAQAIAGTLSAPSKMPCYSYGIPAETCITGSRLVNVVGSVCNGCYALKGYYKTYAKTIKPAQYKRLESIASPLWVTAMIALIAATKNPFFRWHDSGDLQSAEHFEKVVAIARALPNVKFWLPTRELAILRQYKGEVPSNLIVRVSTQMVDARPTAIGFLTSSVHKDKPAVGFECKARFNNNQCGSCRACWNPKVANVSYHAH